MSGKKQILNYARQFVELTPDEARQFRDSFNEARIKKRQFMVQPGFIARYRNFVVKGAFRSYVLTGDGNEHTIQFAIENWWISDFNSYLYQQPATMFVVAIEDSIILQIDHHQEQELKRASHKFETFFRTMAEKGLAFEHRRIITNLTLSAKERYENFLLQFPHFQQRVPQYALASYLGMTTEFLSRIRSKKRLRKS